MPSTEKQAAVSRYTVPSLLLAFFLFSGARVLAQEGVTIVPRIEKLKHFPCSKCHTKAGERHFSTSGADPHSNIAFKHMPEVRDCALCHSVSNPDKLVLLDGTSVTFNEVYQLCRQCHGKIGYNWDNGLHGKQIGHWDGQKRRYVCTECHEAHSPKFPAFLSVKEPTRPRFGISKGDHHP